jgi:DNA-binding NarL/FixJ family response regulator
VERKRPTPLSPREQQVLALVRCGCSSSEIASRLGIGTSTVETHVRSAMRKLEARTRVHAAALAAGAPRARGHESGNGLDEPTLALMRLLARGYTVADAAAALGQSRRTATRRLTRARRALGVGTNAEAILGARP